MKNSKSKTKKAPAKKAVKKAPAKPAPKKVVKPVAKKEVKKPSTPLKKPITVKLESDEVATYREHLEDLKKIIANQKETEKKLRKRISALNEKLKKKEEAPKSLGFAQVKPVVPQQNFPTAIKPVIRPAVSDLDIGKVAPVSPFGGGELVKPAAPATPKVVNAANVVWRPCVAAPIGVKSSTFGGRVIAVRY